MGIQEPGGGDVSIQVTDADKRQIETVGERFGVIDAHNQRSCQTRSLCDGNTGQVFPSQPCFVHGGGGHPFNHLDMSARSEFRDDTAEPLVDGMLGGDDIGEDRPIGCENSGSGFIAGRFESEKRAFAPGDVL